VDRTERTIDGSFYESREPMKIRFATSEDLEALEWDGEYSHYRRLFERAIEEAQHGRRILLLAEIEGQLVGQLFVQLTTRAKSSTEGVSSGYLYAFRVKPPYRNRGVGSQLIHEAESNLSDRGILRAVISVEKRNVAARRLYERAGYAVIRENSGEWSYIDHEGKLREVREPAFVLEKWL
jgi:ribosomal protein S18 acetylase RimI-like enzyme